MSKPHRTQNSVSLFPFLAVLVCAMGALIFLLIVTTRRVRQDVLAEVQVRLPQQSTIASNTPEAKNSIPRNVVLGPTVPFPDQTAPGNKSASEKSEKRPTLVSQLAELEKQWKPKLKQLNQQREQLLQEQQLQNKQIERTGQRLQVSAKKLAELKQKLERLQSNKEQNAQVAEGLRQKQTEVTQKSEKLQKQIARLQQQRAQADSKFAFVPFDGKSGTTRRPILIECTEEGIRFVPEDVSLTPDDLDGFTKKYNPLLAGARALTKYWIDYDRNSAKVSSDKSREPYVLLIVRPSGNVAFYVARHMLNRLEQPFGYELVEADWELKLPEVNPEAEEVCRKAVTRTIEERTQMFEVVRSKDENDFRKKGAGFTVERFAGSSGRSSSTRGSSQPSLPSRLDNRNDSERFSQSRLSGSHRQELFPRKKQGTGLGKDRLASGDDSLSSYPSAGSSRLPSFGDQKPKEVEEGKTSDETFGEFSGGKKARVGESREQLHFPDFQEDKEPSSKKRRENNWTLDSSKGNRKPNGSNAWEGTSSNRARARARNGRAQKEQNGLSPESGNSHLGQQRKTSTGSSSPLFPQRQKMPVLPIHSHSKHSHAKKADRADKKAWGYTNGQAAIGIEQEVRISVGASQIRVGEEPPVSVGRGESQEELSNRLAAAVEKHARSWGKPAKDFYWIPVVQLVIHPGGNQHENQVREALKHWGIFSNVEYSLKTSESGQESE